MLTATGESAQHSVQPLRAAEPGPRVARLFHALLALVSLAAWLSLGAQLLLLVGEHGLSPAGALLTRARESGASVLDLPTLFWLGHSDTLLCTGVAIGALLSLCALFGFAPRSAFAANAVLYLSYTVVCDTFTSFQWDNMLVEMSLLAACLPRDRHAPHASLALKLLLFKLYFESGIAKWQSPIGDWYDGSAMRFYYETSPLPTRLAWYAHHLPEGVHRLESWAALFMELVVPFFVFGPRVLRLVAFAYFSLFLVVDTATSNYGFFTYLAACLNAFLLSDADIERLGRALGFAAQPQREDRRVPRFSRAAAVVLLLSWCTASVVGASLTFSRRAASYEPLVRAHALWTPLRVANVYHLFSQITRERIEPELQVAHGSEWSALAMHYKPGPLDRPPPVVAPHQPRVDFRLWFYGLSFTRGTPSFVRALVDRLCHDPARVQSLFVDPLPEHPDAVRIVFHRYRFTTPEERSQSHAYWARSEIASSQPIDCH